MLRPGICYTNIASAEREKKRMRIVGYGGFVNWTWIARDMDGFRRGMRLAKKGGSLLLRSPWFTASALITPDMLCRTIRRTAGRKKYGNRTTGARERSDIRYSWQ